jgi:tetratricopeptide (TPR) repeat protein
MPKGLAQWGEELFMRRELERRRGLAPENDVGMDIVQRGFEPCLLAVLRLSLGRDADTRLSTGWFWRALARTGHLARAAELAYTISDELKQGEELLALVKAAAGAGDLRGAQALAESIPLRQLRDQALVALVPAWARAGERDRAAALAERIRYPHNWGRAWALLAKVAADNGDTHDALRFAARADAEVSSFVFDGTGQVLALLVEVAAATGDHDRADALADRVEDITRSRNPTAWSWPRPLAVVLACEALRGDLDRIDALLRPPPRPPLGAGGRVCLLALGDTADQDVALQGDLDELDARPLSPRPLLDARDMADVLDAVAETAGQDVALALADRAETLLDTGDSLDHDILLRSVTLLLARRGQVERAMALADWLDPDLRVGRQAEIAGELARYGDTGRAEALAHAITDCRAQARALIEVVRELARRGDPGRAEALAHEITDRWAQGEALVAVVQELARHGDPGRAETLARSIAYRATRVRALAALAELSEPSHACTLAAQVVVLDGWATVLPVLERIAPRAVATVADQMMS